MEMYVILSFISIFSLFFLFSNIILSDASILPVSQLQTQQVMTLQIRSQIEYFIQTYSFSYFMVKIYEKFSLTDSFNTI